jgi:hypothetical protein
MLRLLALTLVVMAATVQAEVAEAEKNEAVDIEKMRTKDIRLELKARGQECKGCSEKHEFVKLLKETFHLPKTGTEDRNPDTQEHDASQTKSSTKNTEKKESKTKAKESKQKTKKTKKIFEMPDFQKMDKKELTDYKWRLKGELKKVETRLKDIKSGGKPADGKGADKDQNPMPDCMKDCWGSFQTCAYGKSASDPQYASKPPSKSAMCDCMPKLRDPTCNSCDATENKNQQSMCLSYGCSVDQCDSEAIIPEAKGKTKGKGSSKSKSQETKKAKSKSVEQDSNKNSGSGITDEELLTADPSKMKVKQLRQILQQRDRKCLGCAEKQDYVTEVLKLIDELQNDELDGKGDGRDDEKTKPAPKKTEQGQEGKEGNEGK